MLLVGLVIGAVVLVVLLALVGAVRIVREYQRIILFRLGRAVGTAGPGSCSSTP